MTAPRIFIRLTSIPPHATEAEAAAIIQAAYEATQAEQAQVTLQPETNIELMQQMEDGE